MESQSSSHDPTLPGTVLAGKYRVERIIGQGGMGVVVEARHISLDERVALKFLLPEFAQHPDAAGRFLREARAAVKIKSEHVARVSDVGTLDNGAPYMVMEYLDGQDLSTLLQRSGVLSVPDAVDYVIQGCEALLEAHGYGIVHRDVKPANLFLIKHPNGSPLVKVLDFGISKVTGPGVDVLTKTSTTMGSALYMSPEQMQAARGVDHRTDIYALGISLYELLAGKQPFYADTLPQLCAEVFTGTPVPIRTVRGDVPPELAAVLEKAYARDRGNRHQSIAELVAALAPFAPARSRSLIEGIVKMGGLSLPGPAQVATVAAAQPVTLPAQAPAPAMISTVPGVPRKSSGLVIALAVVGAAALGGVAYLGLRSSRPRPSPQPAAVTANDSASDSARPPPAAAATTPPTAASAAPEPSAVPATTTVSTTPAASAPTTSGKTPSSKTPDARKDVVGF